MAKSFNSIKAGWSNPNKDVGKKKSFKDIKSADYNFGVDETYLNSFLERSKKYFDNVESETSSVNFNNAESKYSSNQDMMQTLGDEAKTIRAYYNANKGKIDSTSYKNMMEYLDNFEKNSSNVLGYYRNKADLYSKFKTEAEYNDAVKIGELNELPSAEIAKQMGFSSETYETDLAPLKAEYDKLSRDIQFYGKGDKSKFASAKDYNDAKKRRDELAKKMADLKGKNGVAYTTSSGQNITWQSLYDSKKYEEEFNALHGELSSAEDWKKGIEASRKLENPTAREAGGIAAKGVKNRLTYAKKNKYEIEIARANGSDVGDFHLYLEMNSAEEEIYNYYLYKEGEGRAEEFFESIKDSLKKRSENKELEAFARITENTYVIPEVMSVATSVFSGAEYIADAVKGDIGDTNHMANISSTIRGTRMEQIDWEVGGWDAFDFLYGTGMSLADSAVAMATFGGLGGVALGLSAAAQGTNDALNRGMSKGQAFTSGLASGIFEGVFESWSIGAFGDLTKNLKRADFRNLAKYVGKNMWNNAKEEFLTEIANIAYDTLANGDFSQYETAIRQYMSMGLSESEAKKKVSTELGIQVAEAAGSGALMGFGFGVTEGAKARNSITQMGREIKDAGQTRNLVDFSKSLGEGTESYELANKITDKSKAFAIGQLYGIASEDIANANRGDIVKSLERKGYNTDVANHVANMMLDHENTTFDDSRAEKTYNDIINNPNSTVSKREEAYRGIREGVFNDRLQKALSKAVKNKATSTKAEAFTEDQGKEPEQSQNSVESKFESNPEGKDFDTVSGKIIASKKLVSSAKDNMAFEVTYDDGTAGAVNANDISFGNDGEALVYSMVMDMNVPVGIAESLIGGYKGNDINSAGTYINGVREAFVFGKHNQEADLNNGTYASRLTEEQRSNAFKLGKIYAKEKAIADEKAIKGETKPTDIQKKEGKVHFEGDKLSLKSVQDVSVKSLEVLTEAIGKDIHIFESYVDKNGKRVYKDAEGNVKSAPNGFYQQLDGSIWIDLNAGNSGQGIMMYTVAHELTHFIKQWSPTKFNALADFLVEQYGKEGVSVAELVREQQRKAAKHNREISYDVAFEEMVADSMEAMLTDGKVIRELANKDKTLFDKIKSWIDNLLRRLDKEYKNYTPESTEGQTLLEMKKTFGKVQKLFADALMDASDVVSVVSDIGADATGDTDIDGAEGDHMLSDRSMVEGAGLRFVPIKIDGKRVLEYKVEDADGNAVTEVTADMIADSPLGNLVTSAVDGGYISDSDAKVQYKFLAELVNMCIQYKGIAPIWETAGTLVFSAIKNNADKQYGKTIDFSTVCKKTQAIVDAMSGAMLKLGRGLTRAEVETIYLEVGKAGEETPCPVCYVFSRWMGIGGILDQMSRFQNKYVTMKDADIRAFMEDIEDRIEKRANTPNKKGELKATFFDKDGNIKQGQVIADLKGKASSKATSALNALAKNSDIKLEIQELEALMQTQDEKGKKATTKKINALKKKIADVSETEAVMKEANDEVEMFEAYQWLTRTLMVKDAKGNWVRNKDFKSVPMEVLFDLNKGDEFASGYPLSWAFRTGKGASAGKAIVPYADARVGETIQGIAKSDIKDIKVGLDLNPFLNGDSKTQGSLLETAREKQKKQNLIGGQRYQSTSDFRYEYGSDYLITFLEMQAIGAKVQLYTKVIEAVDFLATVGAECNLSVMPLSDGFITLEDGTKKLVYSSVTGINGKAAIEKTHQYNNVQLILVGISDEHISLALEGDEVTFVIPFHGSGNSVHQIQALMNLLGENLDVTTAQDYTPVQSDHHIKNKTQAQKDAWNLRKKIIMGKAGTLTAAEHRLLKENAFLDDLYRRFYEDESSEEYGVALTEDQANQIFPYEYWDKSLTYDQADQNGERFKQYCETLGIVPRFSGMDSDGKQLGFGDFTKNKGYWKLLIDRRMYENVYDADGNWVGYGKYHHPQTIDVTNFKAETIDPAWGTAHYGEVMAKSNDPKKTNKIVDAAIAQFENKGETMLSDRDEANRADQFSYETLTSKPDMKVTVVNDKVTYKPTSTIRKNIVNQAIKNATSFGKTNENGNVIIHVDDIDTDVLLSRQSLVHGLDRRLGTSAPVILNIGSVLKNSIKINELTPDKESAIGSYVLIGYAESTDYAYPVRMVVNQYTNEVDTIDVLYAVNTKKETVGKMPGSHGKTALPTVSNIRIADLLEFVNKHFSDVLPESVLKHYGHTERPKGELGESALFSDRDSEGNELSKEQQEFFKDSKVRDEDGNLLVMYHGTPNGDFNTFQISDGAHNSLMAQYGAGYYFDANKDSAKRYTQDVNKTSGKRNPKIFEVYLNIENPLVIHDEYLDGRKPVITKQQFNDVISKGNYEWFFTNGMPFELTKHLEKSKAEIQQLPREEIVKHWVDMVYDRAYFDSDILSAMVKAYKGDSILGVMKDVFGNDGVKVVDKYGEMWVAWDNSQIKETSNTNPTTDTDIRYSEREVQPITEAKYKDLEKHFGTTGNFKVAGYLLANGKLLDFSGRHWGDTASRTRQVDHRDVQEILDGRGNNGVNAMVDMIGNGNIRLMPEVGGINLAVYPNEKQRRVLSTYINYMLNTEGEVIIDYDAVGGDTVYSKTYGKTATSKQILNDIRNYFNGARQSELMSFHTMYSERDTDSVSTRSLLANALEGTALKPEEKNLLRNYKTNLRLIDGEQAKLDKVRQEYKEIMYKKSLSIGKDKLSIAEFEKRAKVLAEKQGQDASKIKFKLDRSNGKYLAYIGDIVKGKILSADKTFRTEEDTEKLKNLSQEAKLITTRINSYDRELFKLETMKPLKDVLTREKELARKRQKQKDAENLREYKEKVAETTRQLLKKNRESRQKALEGRSKTEMRHKVKKVVNDLNNLLLKPTKERHVPEEMRIAVAEALAIVNMDTVDADTRVAKYNALIAKAKDPDVIASLTESRDRILEQGNKLGEKLTKLKDAYAMINASADDNMKSMYDDVIYNKIESVQKKVGKTPLRNMTLEQLENVYELYKMVLTTVRDSNKAFAEDLKMTRQALGSNTFAEIKDNNKARDRIKFEGIEKFGWKNLKPMQAMKTIGSGILQKLWNNILYGQEVFAQDYDEAVKFAKKMKEKYGYNKWDLDKLYSFESKSGKVMKINLEQMMSIYAYSKRKQADEHIEFGGILLNESIIKEKKLGRTVEVKVNDSTAYRLDKLQVGKIIDTLKKEFPGAKDFVDEMQKYLSETMGEKGNEVSMKMYGIKLFKEEHYFPLKSSKDFMEAANAKLKGDVKIKNKGMTKATVEHASNPIVLEGFLDVWGNHVNEMAMYHGLVLPLEDFSRTLNYGFKADDKLNTDAESVRTALRSAFGESADNYLNELLKAINGGVLHDSSAEIADKMISKFKKAKVLASLSVIVQQPTAIIRAMGIIDPKYFVSQNFNHKATWEELKKYCPTAIIKETGSFDTNMGRTIVDMIKEDRSFTDKVGDALGKAPAYMDEMGWNMIWRALKNKVATEQNLSGEELLKECGKQMTLIINETQVYDSVMSRNELMRSKSTFTKMATSFMGEPATVANMIYGAVLDFKRGNKSIAGKTVAAVISSVVINGLVSSLVYAFRDDDEEKTFLEKYLSSATTEVLDGLNPLTYIPIIKDVYSLFQGYDVERTDIALIGDVVDAINDFFDVFDPEAYEGMSGGEIARLIYENSVPLLTSICDMFGLPVGNILRDAEAIIINDNLSISKTSGVGTGLAIKDGWLNSSPKFMQKFFGGEKYHKLYLIANNGDNAYVKNEVADMVANKVDSGKTEKEAKSSVKSSFTSTYRDAYKKAYNKKDAQEMNRIRKFLYATGLWDSLTELDNLLAKWREAD